MVREKGLIDRTIDQLLLTLAPKALQNHLEERLLDQAQARALYTPFFGVVRVAYPKA